MDLATLQARFGQAVRALDVAAPVDLQYLFRDGVLERDALTGARVVVADRAGVVVLGAVTVDELELTGHALFVLGDVTARTITLDGSMVVLGNLRADLVRGRGEPFTLTVLGEVSVARAVMEEQFVMQFLGKGTIDLLVDTEGGADELIQLLRQ